MAKFVYVDETGASGKGCKRQPYVTAMAAIVDETEVQKLKHGLQCVAVTHLGYMPRDFEFHGYEIWNGTGLWACKTHQERIGAFEAAVELLQGCDIDLAHATIDKEKLSERHDGKYNENAYRLALQFLLEKVDQFGSELKVVVADEAHQSDARAAIDMVDSMQNWPGAGEVPGRQFRTVIDTLHYVRSNDSPGVQMADLAAYVIQRGRRQESHPNAQAALDRLSVAVNERVRTYRQPWP